jgi:hypothetical protein
MKILETRTTGGDTVGIVVDKIDAIIDKGDHTDIHLTGHTGAISIEEPYNGVITALRDDSPEFFILPSTPQLEEVEPEKGCSHIERVFNRGLNIIECSGCGKVMVDRDMAEGRN